MTVINSNEARDPYRRCETKCISFGDNECRPGVCRHDTGRGLTLAELLTEPEKEEE